ncbi:MAG TPA: amino acid adenylation domain-containing protein [Bryobacteraceae bacterium]|nr:amino acid adenylation domain-containing protein [Bryobacteraceae bacterium]
MSDFNSVDMLPAEKHGILPKQSNDTAVPFSSDLCAHQLFEAHVLRTPDATAVVFEDLQLSYDELNRRANQLAHHLRELGVGPDCRVALCLERGFPMVVAVLAVWKAGGAYVPLDPAYPEDRLRFMLEDSAPAVLLTNSHLAGRFAVRAPVLAIDEEPSPGHNCPEINPDPAAIGLTPRRLAYVIYTSGSTGTPKGVMVEHQGLVNLAQSSGWAADSSSRILQFASFSFDASVWETVVAFGSGACLCLAPADALRPGQPLLETLHSHAITHVLLPPSVAVCLLEERLPAITNIIVGGEACAPEIARRWALPHRLRNAYGPTEATVCATTYQCNSEPGRSVPIGRPIANARVYILDTNRHPVPIGDPGEIYVGGIGVARGYLNLPDLTADRFLYDPFAPEAGARMYKTGDLGRWLPDGDIEFLGRNDFQVKVRGFRIELGEIEARLLQHPGVHEAVVIARQDQPGDKRLVAYVVPRAGESETLDAETLRLHLSASLPEYMLPVAYVRLDALPLTHNGKLDRKALPAPDPEAYSHDVYDEPQGETETLLAQIWSAVLGLERVGRQDHFFQLGGHSLRAITVLEHMRRHGLQADIRALYKTPTLAAFAAAASRLASFAELPANGIPPGSEVIVPEMLSLVTLTQQQIHAISAQVPGGAANIQDIYPLAPLQEGILFHHLLSTDRRDPYLIRSLLAFSNRQRLEAYLTAMQMVVDRHDIWRTAIFWEGLPEAVQVVLRTAQVPVEEVALDPAAGDALQQLRSRFDLRYSKLNLQRAPLLRAVIAHDHQQSHWLLLLLQHHLTGDRVTTDLLQEEIEAHLGGKQHQLPEPLPFRNVVAHTRLGMGKAEHEAYFRQMLGDVEEPTAPFGLLEVRGDGSELREKTLDLPHSLSARIREQARQHGVSAASLFHLAWAEVLTRVSGRSDVVFGTVLFGRMQGGEGADRVMGPFINTLPLRICIDGKGVAEGVHHTHALLADLLLHEHASLALAQRCSAVPAPAPLFSSLLNYRHSALAPSTGIRHMQEWISAEERTNYPFGLAIDDLGDGFRLIALTDASIDPLCVCRFMEAALSSLVTALEQAPETPLDRLDVLPEAERRQVLWSWNDTAASVAADLCAHQLFEEHALRAPEATAVVFEDQRLTYGELNRQANQLAHYLCQLGVRPDDRVALCLDRGFPMVVALLAVWKAGAAYVPLDSGYPEDRLRFMLEDSAPLALLTNSHLAQRFSLGFPVLSLDTESNSWQEYPEVNPDPVAIGLTPHHLAYIIYTSGSTGMPKGVMLEHLGLVNLVQSPDWPADSSSRILQFASFSFDGSVFEFVMALTRGATLHLLSPSPVLAGQSLQQILIEQKITHAILPPSVLASLPDPESLPALRLLTTSGEALPVELGKRWAHGRTLINGYGPTEATVCATLYPCSNEWLNGRERRSIPIGRPISNTRIYILDVRREPVPVGAHGEIYISGAGLARGYWRRDDLTAERFLPDPFAPEPGARMYKTGDLGRWLPDGNIEFLGRNDFQVKLRGFRIEPGEIEARLSQHPGVREAAVMARQDQPGDKRLVAYVVPRFDLLQDLFPRTPAEATAHWKTLYEQIGDHQDDSSADASFNLAGWNSSYTRQPLPAEEMREQIDGTVARLLAGHPRRILEIGCGTGLLLFRLAPHCEHYTGTDILGSLLQSLRQQIAHRQLHHVQVLERAADQLDDFPPASFDLVVINSVVQYFPSIDYLLDVLRRVLLLVRPGGTIQVGDCRNLALLDTYHLSVQSFQAPDSLAVAELAERIRQSTSNEEELLLHPAFFAAFQAAHPQVGDVVLQLRRGQFHNELTRFRYDAFLHIAVEPPQPSAAAEFLRHWPFHLDDIRTLLRDGHPPVLRLTGIPNARLAHDLRLGEYVRSGRFASVSALREALSATPPAPSLDPEQLWALAEQSGYQAELSWSSDGGADRRFTAVLRRHPVVYRCKVPVPALAPIEPQRFRAFANNPRAGELSRLLLSDLKTHLETHLPEYMLPAAYVRLDALPLTHNGKLDRKALPAPDFHSLAHAYEEPQGETEQQLAHIWAQVLNLDRVGRHDNFFELGGHSLLAITLIERMRQHGIQADVRALFNTPTIAELAGGVAPGPRIPVPPNLIADGSTAITPEMLPLVDLTQDDIDRLAAQAPGGIGNIQDIYPLAPVQEGILFHYLLAREDAPDPYLAFGLMAFSSRKHLDTYLRAMQQVLNRHDIWRTAIFWEGLPEPVQVVLRTATLPVQQIELNDDVAGVTGSLQSRFTQRYYKLDIRRAPLIRIFITEDAAHQRWLMLLQLHHLAGDHTTLELMQEEIGMQLFGQQDRLPEALPFRNFVAEARLGISKAEHEAYFRHMLGDVDEPTAPFGLLEIQGDGSQIREAVVEMPASLASRIRQQARQRGVSAASLCHLAWAKVLASVSGRNDVVFGTVLFGRMHSGEGADRVMGPFINTLPLRIRVSDQGVLDAVRHTHKLLAELLRHEHASLALAQRSSAVRAPIPLFSSLLNYRHSAAALPPDIARLGVEWLEEEDRTNYPFTLSVDDLSDGFRLTAQVDASVDPRRVCGFMEAALSGIVTALEQAPETPVRSLDVLPASERQLVLEEWNRTEAEFPADQCVHELFEEQAAKTPDAVAVVFEDEQLSYGELNRRANQLAHYLRELGVRPDHCVAICVERSLEMVVGLLAILKAGGAYVPMDPAYPAGRLRFMLQDSRPVALLTHGHLASLFAGHTDGLPVLDLTVAPWRDCAEENPGADSIGLTSNHLAYVIYTSGSTGQPKGVTVEHRNIIRLVQNTNYVDFSRAHTIGHLSNVAFDAATFEIWGALLNGCRIAIVPRFEVLAPQNLALQLNTLRVSTLFLTTALFNECVRSQPGIFDQMDQVMFGGEMCDPECVRQALEQSARLDLIHVYGPTETTTFASHFPIRTVRTKGSVPIGKPIANTRIYILDGRGEPVPVGVSGELYIGGTGVARGYLNRPELTAQKFLIDPFTEDPGARMYRTGDLGRWLPDGNIEFLGRNDDQVKVRGFRIELGEIESRLMGHPAVREAVVLAREDDAGDKRLVGYYTQARSGEGEEAGAVSAEQLRSHLSASLPEYMVPAAYVRLEQLPLTPNRKLDRKALPIPDSDAYTTPGYAPPEGEVETQLAEIWAEVLKLDCVGRHDNFFELGGHSLIAVRVINRIQQALHRTVPLRNLFTHPTLKGLADVIRHAGQNQLPAIAPADRSRNLPLSFAQQRLWFLAQLEGSSQTYHMPGALELRGEVDRFALRRTLDHILARHEALRTTFTLLNGSPVQQITSVDQARFQLLEHDLRHHPDPQGELERLGTEEPNQPFDLEHGPLIRGRLIQLEDDRYVLLLTMHHIVSDGWSMGVFTNEFSALYQAFHSGVPDPLPPLPLQYVDYALWQRQWMEGEVLQGQAQFWKENLAGAPPLLDVPRDHPRPAQQDFTGAFLPLELDAELTAGLRRLCREHNTTLYMALLAGWAILLARLSGQHDLVIGSPTANRGRREIEGLIGFFVNTLALRIKLEDSPSVVEVLERVKAQMLAAQQNQDIPFEQVVELVQPVRSLSHTPLFQVLFDWQNASQQSFHFPGLELNRFEINSYQIAQFEFGLSLEEAGETIIGSIAYSKALFERSTVERYAGYLLQLLRSMIAAPEQSIHSLPMLSLEERNVLLYRWNDTAAAFPADLCVHHLFEAQAQKTPHATAVVYEGQQLSYGELNRRANQLAHYLRELGIRPDDRVALCVERGLPMMVGLLAVFKAGGAYVPLDPAYPEERLRFMLDDAQPVALLTQSHQAPRFPVAVRVLHLDTDLNLWRNQPQTNPDPAVVDLRPHHLAYIIYTSGSTGLPKGVSIEHRNIVNFVTWAGTHFSENTLQRTLASTSLNFDLAVFECLVPLTTANTVEIVRDLLDLVRRPVPVTLINTVPSAMKALLTGGATFDGVRAVNLAGEPLKQELAERIFAETAIERLSNLYGPSETTTYSTWVTIRRGEPFAPHIGRPVANTRIYILDAQGEPMPIGVAGEIYIGGAGVARGYLNRPKLTAERFLPDPFASEPGARMYRTGDRGRWLADGNIEFLGRNDFQVKIRGFRIELGEIEARLAELGGIREAVVVAREDQFGDQRLIAYYVPLADDPQAPDANTLRTHLVASLPGYMVPSAYVALDALPLTPNGKLDTKALPGPDTWGAARSYEPPEGDTELVVSRIWADVLGCERVGRHDNFFELGGHSLLAVTLIDRLRPHGMDADIRRVFDAPTLAEFVRATRTLKEIEL